MTALNLLLDACDAVLIAPFRLPASPEAGFFVGVAVLALGSAAAGRGCMALVAWLHRVRRAESDREMARRTELSTLALKAGDKAAYLVQNRLAKDAYGTHAALAAARGAALLWPGAVGPGLAVLAVRGRSHCRSWRTPWDRPPIFSRPTFWSSGCGSRGQGRWGADGKDTGRNG